MIFYDSFYFYVKINCFLKFNYKKYDIKYKIMIKFILQKYFGGNGDESSNSVESNPKVSQTQTAEKADDNVSVEFSNALKKAKSYSDMMHMSKAGIYDQLTSEYGESFEADAAQYAIDISLTIFTHSLTYLIKHQLCGLENDSYTKNHLFGIFFCI